MTQLIYDRNLDGNVCDRKMSANKEVISTAELTKWFISIGVPWFSVYHKVNIILELHTTKFST